MSVICIKIDLYGDNGEILLQSRQRKDLDDFDMDKLHVLIAECIILSNKRKRKTRERESEAKHENP